MAKPNFSFEKRKKELAKKKKKEEKRNKKLAKRAAEAQGEQPLEEGSEDIATDTDTEI